MSIEQNKALVIQMLKYLSESKFDEMVELFHDDLEWTVMGDPSLFPAAGTNNKQKQTAILQGLSSLTCGGLTMTVNGITAEGNRVAVEATSSAKLANGKPYSNCYHFLFEVKDGKVIIAKEYCDTLLALHSFS